MVQRREAQISGDAGLRPIREFDQRWAYTARLADCLSEARDVIHVAGRSLSVERS